MKKFEIGKRYGEHTVVYEIVSRTEKYITYIKVQHAGRYNERKYDSAKVKIRIWDNREVFFSKDAETVMA